MSPAGRRNLSVAAGLALPLLVVAAILWATRDSRMESDYRLSIEAQRREKDSFLRSSSESPLAEAEREGFGGLRYYAADSAYRVVAEVQPISNPTVSAFPTNTGSVDAFERVAWAQFEIAGARHRLLLLRSPDSQISNRLFLAFYDGTNGSETYPGGRYIDIYQQTPGTVTIDFNQAYNPYCVYTISYVCPLPPVENRLAVPIRAGEKMYRATPSADQAE